MSRAKTLRDLESNLKAENIKLKNEESKLFDSNKRLNMDVFSNIEIIRTEIYTIKRKIIFIKQGKPPLGEEFNSFNY